MLEIFSEVEESSPVTEEGASPTWQDDSQPGRKLIDYLEPKIHHLLKRDSWKRVFVVGCYARGGKNIPSHSERRGRGFNWQRPTAEIIDDDTIRINCFPSENYVRHHAGLISRYFKLQGSKRPPPTIFISLWSDHLDEPLGDIALRNNYLPQLDASQSDAYQVFCNSNLSELGETDIVILGYLDTCPDRVIEKNPFFQRIKINDEGKMFSWHKYTTRNGTTVAYLGCAHALWGQCVGHLVSRLKELCRVEHIVYVGKAGSLDDAIPSNEYLATGDLCDVDASLKEGFRTLKMNGINFSSDSVQTGGLVTVASPLCEDENWFQRCKGEYRWVDCETAYMAFAAHAYGVDFAYLHVVSDNLGKQYSENLANEDDEVVQKKRAKLFEDIDRLLEESVKRVGKAETWAGIDFVRGD